jgi:hypothetical protein
MWPVPSFFRMRVGDWYYTMRVIYDMVDLFERDLFMKVAVRRH